MWDEWTLRQIALAIDWEGCLGVFSHRSAGSVAGVTHSPCIIVNIAGEDRVLVDHL